MKVIDNNRVIYSFKPKMTPIERVKVGEVFKVRTNDCYFGQVTEETQDLSSIDHSRINPATGPIYVEGAEPGDLLKIEILKIDITSKGVEVIIPGEGVLGDKVKKSMIRIIPIKDGYSQFNNLSIPNRPMIGVIGVAPSDKDGECPTNTPWKHGGNMDTTDICEGSTLYLPVRQKGALLALGDCHAIMGDGEVCIAGCEVAGEVTLKVNLLKDKPISWPLVETDKHTMVITSGVTLEDATVNATNQTVEHLQNGLKLSWEDAYILSSLIMDLKISQVINPRKTVRATIPKNLLQTDILISSIN